MRRLPGWAALVASLSLLLGVGALGVALNRSAVSAADRSQRIASIELASNNAALVDQYIRLSAEQLAQTVVHDHPTLEPGSRADEALLRNIMLRSALFGYGAALADVNGNRLTHVTDVRDLPSFTDPGYAPLWRSVRSGDVGVSSVMEVDSLPLVAVAVPIISMGKVKGALLGYTDMRVSLLQSHVARVGAGTVVRGIIDSLGRVVAISDERLIGEPSPHAIAAEAANGQPGGPRFIYYHETGDPMIAVVATGLLGGWAFYQTQTTQSFYGPARDRSVQSNLALLVLVIAGGCLITIFSHRSTEAGRRSERRFSALVQRSTDLISVLDRSGMIVYDSPSVVSVLGFPAGSRVGEDGLRMVHAEEQERVQTLLRAVSERPGEASRTQCRVVRADGEYLWVDLSVSNLVHDPAVRGFVVNARDVSESRDMQDQLFHQATHDVLTGLPNRRFLHDRLAQSTDRGGHVTLLFVDLDRFKAVNDERGHEAGDELLRQVGARVRRCVEPGDTVARVGGDEFVVLLDGLADHEVAARIAQDVIDALTKPFSVLGQPTFIGASVGIVVGEPHTDPDGLLNAADGAMYRAKQSGRQGGGSIAWAQTPVVGAPMAN